MAWPPRHVLLTVAGLSLGLAALGPALRPTVPLTTRPTPALSEAAAAGPPSSSATPPPPVPAHPSGNDTVLRCSRATARQAMAWLAGHPAALRKDDFPSRNRFRVVVDYAADPEGNYTLPALQPPDWAFLTAYYPAANPFALQAAGGTAPNQLVLAPPGDLNLRTLWASMNLFDTQLLLRPLEVLAALQNASLLELLGNTLPLARTTLLVLPAPEAEGAVNAAAQWALAQQYVLGVRQLRVTVRRLAELTAPGCAAAALLDVALARLVKGTRHTWCFYTGGHEKGVWVKFVLSYTANQSLRVARDGDAAAGKVLHDWLPNMNFGDVLGWGVTPAQRAVMYWDILLTPPWPDYNTHNWVVSRGGHIHRIDFDIRSFKKHPMGRPYLQRLRQFLCLPPTLTREERRCRDCSACRNTGSFAFRAQPPKACGLCLACLRQEHLRTFRTSPAALNATFGSCIGHHPPNPDHLFLVTPRMCSVGQAKP
eukprot:EG_transcript_8891